MPPMVPVSYPNRTPPNATKRPTAMAGHAEPAVPGGGLRVIGILYQLPSEPILLLMLTSSSGFGVLIKRDSSNSDEMWK